MFVRRHVCGVVLVAVLIAAPALAGMRLGPIASLKPLKDPGGVFTVSVPQAWKAEVRQDVVTAENPQDGTYLNAHSVPRQAQDLGQAAQAVLEMATRGDPNWKEQSRAQLQVCGFDGVMIQGSVKKENLEIVEQHYVVLTPKHEALMMLSCAKKLLAKNEPIYKSIVGSWQVVAKEGPVGPADAKEVRDPDGAFAVHVPKDWECAQEGATLSAEAPDEKSGMMIDYGQKSVENVQQFAEGAIESIKQNVTNWKEVSRESVQVAGSPGLKLRATATVEGEPKLADFYFVVTDRTQLVLYAYCSPNEIQKHEPIFQAIAASLKVDVGPGGPAKIKEIKAPNGLYTLAVPEGWEVEAEGGTVLAESTMQPAGVVAYGDKKEYQTLPEFVAALVKGQTQQDTSWKKQSEKPVEVSGHKGTVVFATVTIETVPYTFSYMLVLTDKHQYWLRLGRSTAAQHLQQVLVQIGDSWKITEQ